MRRLVFAFGAAAVIATTALAQDRDPIDTRQALMHANGGAAGLSGAMLKNELDYSIPAGRAAIMTFGGVAASFGDYFPEGSMDPERSRALEAIWEDMEGFQSKLADFRNAAVAAKEAAGKEGPADLAAFQEAVNPVLESCKSCHEDYRREEKK